MVRGANPPLDGEGDESAASQDFPVDLSGAGMATQQSFGGWRESSVSRWVALGRNLGTFRRWIEDQREAIQRLPEKRVAWLTAAADAEARKVTSLEDIDPESIKTVEDAVRGAYWSDNSRASWSTVLREFLYEHPVYSIAAILLFIGLSAQKLGPWLFDWEDFPGLSSGVPVAIATYSLLLIFLMHGRILAILRLIGSWLPVVWRLAVTSAAIYLISWGGWRGSFTRWMIRFRVGNSKDVRSAFQYADLLLVHVLKFFVVFELVWLIFSLLTVLTYKVGPKEPDDAVFSSRIVLELLSLAYLAQVASGKSRRGQSGEGFRPYVASGERREILESLDRIARIAGGRWKRSLRVGDQMVDSAVAAIGDGIAVSAGRWKAVAATGGDRLPEMRKAFAVALSDAAQGNWERLATEVSSKDLLRRRVLRFMRHLLALCIMLGTAYLVLLDPFSWFGKATNPAVNSFILMFAAILSITIDPTIVERLGSAAKVSGHFSSKK